MFLLVGLGNPGPKYQAMRHNVGFMAADAIARRHGFAAWRSRFQGLTAEGTIGGEKVLALKPLTFMNESGRAVGEAMRFHKVPGERVVVLYDELDLKPGRIRVKFAGGAGGHNGIRSIDAHVGQDYWRVRIGIGHPGDKERVLGYVLQDFAKPEREGWLPVLLDAVADEAALLVTGEQNAFMSRVMQAVFPPPPRPAPRPAPGSAPGPKPGSGDAATEGNDAAPVPDARAAGHTEH